MPRDEVTPLIEALAEIERDLERIDTRRHGGSRYVGEGADPEVAAHVARGGSVERGTGKLLGRGDGSGFDAKRVAEPRGGSGRRGAFAKTLLDIATHNVAHLERTPRDWVADGKALAEQTDSAGGYILPIEISTDIAQLIRANTIWDKIPGVTEVHPVGKQYWLPGLATGASAGYLPENAAIPATTETFQIMAEAYPKALATLLAVSNWLLNDAQHDPSIEDVIKNDMAAAMAVAQDSGFFYGNATNGAPKGITTYSNLTVGPNLGTNGSAPTYDLLQQVPAALRTVNAPFKNPGWVVSPKLISNLLAQTDSLGRPLFAGSPELLSLDSSTNAMTGTLLGFRFVSSNSIPSNQTVGANSNGTTVIFGSDWQECYFLEWEGISVAASSEAAYSPDGSTWISAFQSYQTLFRPITRHDVQLRRPQFFVASTGWLV